MHQVMWISFDVSMHIACVRETRRWTAKSWQRRLRIATCIQVVVHAVVCNLAIGKTLIAGMRGLPSWSRNINVCVPVGSVAHGDVEGISTAVRQSPCRE